MLAFVLSALTATLAIGANGRIAAADESPWRVALLKDARALHDTFKESHPGAVDPENPAFAQVLSSGLRRAEARAGEVRTFGGYRAALQEYVAAFQDGHVSLSQTPGAPAAEASWPGFLTRQVGQAQVVATTDGGEGKPALGAVLQSCDGISAADLLQRRVGQFRGRWELESQREAHAWRLFLDVDNPFAPRPSRCTFNEPQGPVTYTLAWSKLTPEALAVESRKVTAIRRSPVALRSFNGTGLWISAGTFTSDMSTPGGQELELMVKQLGARSAELKAASVIVLDVRGNGGGSSMGGRRIAEVIWGKANADAAAPRAGGVDWRVSEENIAALEEIRNAPGAKLPVRVWAGNIVQGLRKARQEGRPLWRETAPFGGIFGGKSRSASANFHRSKLLEGPPVFVLTDAACASACLDALDLWKRLGAIQVGRETSADSLYMEVRTVALPSGLSTVTVPMKVYRDRPRGLNQPHRPEHRLGGDITDTAAMEAAILKLLRVREAGLNQPIAN